MKLLVIEDNPRLSDRVRRRLGKKYYIDIAETGNEALQKVNKCEYDLIILDLGLPDMSGKEICKKLRDVHIKVPILVLTGTDEKTSRIDLLDCGADDYVVKPFDSDELRARIDALLRRKVQRELRKILQYQDLMINLDDRTVSRAGADISLRRKEFDILEYLISNHGRILTREMIIHHAWDDYKVNLTSTVDVHIKHLRDKIDRPFGFPIIKTAYGLGYKVDALE
ncbi:MAG: response regulator transcription factor [Candidatus Microsaccharimonas sp.]